MNHAGLSESLRLEYMTLPVELQDDRILVTLSSIVESMNCVYTAARQVAICNQIRIYGRLRVGILRPTSEKLVYGSHLVTNRIST